MILIISSTQPLLWVSVAGQLLSIQEVGGWKADGFLLHARVWCLGRGW